MLTRQAMDDYLSYNPEILVTACPMCKKTFSRDRRLRIMDIAEVVVENSQINWREKQLSFELAPLQSKNKKEQFRSVG
jgi:hypothetical protein